VLTIDGARYFRGSAPTENRLYRSTISLAESPSADPGSHLALSPDGRRLAFVAPDANGRVMLWVRPLDGFEAQPLAGTEGAAAPFWSPDSRNLAFVAGGKLKRIDAAGGPTVTLCDAEATLPGAWNPGDVMLFTPNRSSALFRVAATGGTPSPATTVDSSKGVLLHAFPSFLPDGQHFLFLSQSPNGSARGLEIGSLDSTDRKRLIEGASNGIYTNGYVIFLRESTLMAQRLDPVRLELTGDAVPVAENVNELGRTLLAGTSFAVSQNGVLVYRTRAPEKSQLVWFDQGGRQLGVLGDPDDYGNLWLSPDGRQAGVEVSRPSGQAYISLFDTTRGVPTRLTSDRSDHTYPIWSPDGTRVVFTSRRKGHMDLYEKAASGATGSETVLLSDSFDKFPTSWSPDGRFILYTAVSPTTEADLWILPLTGERKPYPFLQTQLPERQGKFSPDGRWVAYQPNESGQDEILVAPFPGPGGSSRVSAAGGSNPQWRRDGNEIFYLAPDGNMMASAVTSNGGRFEVGLTRPLFRVRARERLGHSWEVLPDGQRFLVNTAGENLASSITLVVNWMAGLNK
jgi:eukaryotic-like serine/threonine-protein kinase